MDYMNSGVICDINADLLETEISDNGMIDMYGYDAMISSTGSFIEIPPCKHNPVEVVRLSVSPLNAEWNGMSVVLFGSSNEP